MSELIIDDLIVCEKVATDQGRAALTSNVPEPGISSPRNALGPYQVNVSRSFASRAESAPRCGVPKK